MLPLLTLDRLILPVVVLTGIYLLLIRLIIVLTSTNDHPTSKLSSKWDVLSLNTISDNKSIIALFYLSTFVGCGSLLVGQLFVKPPKSLPFLLPLLISVYCCAHFVIFFLYFNHQQLFVTKTAAHSYYKEQHLHYSKVKTSVQIKKRV